MINVVFSNNSCTNAHHSGASVADGSAYGDPWLPASMISLSGNAIYNSNINPDTTHLGGINFIGVANQVSVSGGLISSSGDYSFFYCFFNTNCGGGSPSSSIIIDQSTRNFNPTTAAFGGGLGYAGPIVITPVTTGTANAQVVANAPYSAMPPAGTSMTIIPGATNTGATTLNATSAAVAVNKVLAGSLVALAGGELVINIPVTVVSNGTVWIALPL
jgi:hypothetical protein